jgi:tetraacyldisaccharide 4'-kinase
MPAISEQLQRAWSDRRGAAIALLPFALLFRALVALRRALYALGWLRRERLPVPVVVVGNLVAGGAGKTPTVRAIVTLLQRHGHRPGIVSRGYGREHAGVLEVEPGTSAHLAGDEPLLLRRRAAVPVFVGRDRVAAGRALLQACPDVDVLVSDDGLQHLRLARDAEVLVFDERGVGNGWLLPAGPLREPLEHALPAGRLVLYNATTPTTSLPGFLATRRLSGALSLADWWAGAGPDPDILAALCGRPVVAAAGLARPERFFGMLRAQGLDVIALPLPDHFDFASLPWPADAADVIVTEKDAVKLPPERAGAARVWVAALDLVPEPAFEAQLLRLLEGPFEAATDHGNPLA